MRFLVIFITIPLAPARNFMLPVRKIVILEHFADSPDAHIVSGTAAHHDDGFAAAGAHEDLPVRVLCDTTRERLP